MKSGLLRGREARERAKLRGNCIYCYKLNDRVPAAICSSCLLKYRKRSKEYPERGWSSRLKYTYNITIEQYNNILKVQNYSCAICGSKRKIGAHKLCVDHDHHCCPDKRSCGKCVRGLLCKGCNIVLGRFETYPVLAYLNLYKGSNDQSQGLPSVPKLSDAEVVPGK